MTTPLSCPFCSYEVLPARGRTGALVCPLCRNTGKTERPDTASIRRTLTTFEARIVDHLARMQALLGDVVHAAGRTEGTVDPELSQRVMQLENDIHNLGARTDAATTAAAIRLGGTPTAQAVDERVTQMEERLDDLAARTETAMTATAIRLHEDAATKNMDDLVDAVGALQADIRSLHDEYERASVPALRHQVKVLAARIGALERQNGEGHERDEPAAAEWERPEPWTVDDSDTPYVTVRTRAHAVEAIEAVEVDRDEPTRHTRQEEPLVASAAGRMADPAQPPSGPGDDFSGVPPVMDDQVSMRDLVARDAIAMPGIGREPGHGTHESLHDIEAALNDIDQRLRTLRER